MLSLIFQTCGLKRSREKSNDYCDIEFVSREDAQDAIQNCTIDKIDFKWAPEDIYKKKAKGMCDDFLLVPKCSFRM